jgi:hypothetical protein
MGYQTAIAHDVGRFAPKRPVGGAGASSLQHFPVTTAAERRKIFKLRYDAFTRDGLIRENPYGSLSDWQDDDPATTTYGVTLKGKLVATIRLCMVGAEARDCMTHAEFAEIIDPILERGETIADGSRLAVLCDDPATRRRVLVYTLGIAVGYAREHGANLGMMLARHQHASFYERCGFEQIFGPCAYEESLVPLTLMMIRLPKPEGQLCTAASAAAADPTDHRAASGWI